MELLVPSRVRWLAEEEAGQFLRWRGVFFVGEDVDRVAWRRLVICGAEGEVDAD